MLQPRQCHGYGGPRILNENRPEQLMPRDRRAHSHQNARDPLLQQPVPAE
jgi:hypothetical protein